MRDPLTPECAGLATWSLLLAAFAACFLALPTEAKDELKLPPLTSVSNSPRLQGKFVWADLITRDASKAATFYNKLFGWTFQDFNGYLIAASDQRPICGIVQRPPPPDRPSARSRWFGYVSVANVSKAEQATVKSGGRVLAPRHKVSGRGEQAVLADPEGAVFGVIKSSGGDPDDFLADPGEWIWVQLVSRDAKRAGDFYQAVAGYDVLENDLTTRLGDFVFSSKGYARAAAITLPSDAKEFFPTWLLFVRVKDVGECLARVEQLGGKVVLAPQAPLFGGKVAVAADPTGAEFGVLEWSGNNRQEGAKP